MSEGLEVVLVEDDPHDMELTRHAYRPPEKADDA
jgi:hypothetical protein